MFPEKFAERRLVGEIQFVGYLLYGVVGLVK
jgi:hypothetical protein